MHCSPWQLLQVPLVREKERQELALVQLVQVQRAQVPQEQLALAAELIRRREQPVQAQALGPAQNLPHRRLR
jgi:hypothetical protein